MSNIQVQSVWLVVGKLALQNDASGLILTSRILHQTLIVSTSSY